MEDMECVSGRTKQRQPREYRDLINRLSRIEGQIRGLKGMVESNAYCTDILTQSSAASHKSGEAYVKLCGEVSDNALADAVTGAGYQVKSVKRR